MPPTTTPPPPRHAGSAWAPLARQVAFEDGDGRHHPMQRADDGWWHLGRRPTGRYRYVVDGDPLPDPRAAAQPEGVDGPSEVVDHAAFPWTDADWRGAPLGAAVLYECHVGTFSEAGTFDGAAEKLDHLVDLGVTALELMPVATFPGRWGWGYDGVLLYAPHHAYGGPEGLKRLVDACHARGMAVVLDVVYNHFGPSGNHLARFGPYLTDRHHTPWGGAVNLDGPGSDEVRRFFCDNARQWLADYHIDGLRLDAVHALVDQSAVPFLEQLVLEVHDLSRQLGRQLFLVAESDLGDPRLVRAREAGGLGLDAQWADDLHHALHAALTGERDGYYADYGSLATLAEALDAVFTRAGRYVVGRQRHHGRPVGELPRDRFVTALQNHDQVGNRAVGERLGHLVPPGLAAVGAALSLLAPTVPMLFQGEEWGASAPFQYFTDFDDAELGAAVREGRRSEFAAFGWAPESVPDPQAAETFARSRLDWDELDRGEHRALLAWYRDLLALRRAWPDLALAEPTATATTFDEGARWLVLHRGRLRVAANLGEGPCQVPLEALALARPEAGGGDRRAGGADHGVGGGDAGGGGEARVLAASAPGGGLGPGGLSLPGQAVVVLGPASTGDG